MSLYEETKFDLIQDNLSNVKPADILVFCVVRNEQKRLPWFLKYYRDLGVSHFLIIDNCSDDNTINILVDNNDISVFSSSESYARSSAGRLWTSTLAIKYGIGHWCLTIDADELLTYPNAEKIKLNGLCGYLDSNGYQGFYTMMLDMYGKEELDRSFYEPGKPFIEHHNYVDPPTNYSIKWSSNFPYLQIIGGPRHRMLGVDEKQNSPSMKKVPLVKWHEDFRYLYSTHSCTPIKLSRTTGVLLHYKFLENFKEFVSRELKRGDRTRIDHYESYQRALDRNKTLHYKDSLKIASSKDITVNNFMHVSNDYTDYFGMSDEKLICQSNMAVNDLKVNGNYANESIRPENLGSMIMFPSVWETFNRALYVDSDYIRISSDDLLAEDMRTKLNQYPKISKIITRLWALNIYIQKKWNRLLLFVAKGLFIR